MEIQSKLEERNMRSAVMTIHINQKDIDTLVKVIGAVSKRAKLDRLEEYVICNLVEALTNPAEPPVVEVAEEIPEPKVQDDASPEAAQVKVPLPEVKDKVRMVSEIKRRLDPRDEKSIDVFVKESIVFGQKQFGIKTVPKSNSVESFFDWLRENNIVDAQGVPVRKA